MKTIKIMLAAVLLATGLSATAQTHDNNQPAKQQDAKTYRKVNKAEKAKPMPDGKVKAEDKGTGSTTGPGVPADKAANGKTPANTNDKASQQKQEGNQNSEKMKEIKRPVKKTSGNRAGN